MNKKQIIIIAIAALIILFIAGLNLTGFVVDSTPEVSVFRIIQGNEVQLSVVSSENTLAIQEDFSSSECKVINYSIEPEIDIFAFKETENTWVLANQGENLIVDLSYTIGADSPNTGCSVVSGRYFILSGGVLEQGYFGGNWCNGADINEDGFVGGLDKAIVLNNWGMSEATHADGDVDGDGFVGGKDYGILMENFGHSCVKGSGTQVLNQQATPGVSEEDTSTASASAQPLREVTSNEITSVDNPEQLSGFIEDAIRRISGEQMPGELKKGQVILFLTLILVGIGIIVFLAISFLRKRPQN